MIQYLERPDFFSLLKLEDNFKNPFDFGSDFHVLDALTRYIKPKLALEIGTCNGYSTKILAKNCGDVITVDPHPSRKYLANPIQAQELKPIDKVGWACFDCDNVHQLFTDSLNLPRLFTRNAFDFIYLDGCHDLKHVVSDSDFAFNVLNTPGIVCWHDYKNPDVPDITTFLDDYVEDKYGFYHVSKWTVFKGVK